jgi:hypothetical protein
MKDKAEVKPKKRNGQEINGVLGLSLSDSFQEEQKYKTHFINDSGEQQRASPGLPLT